MQIDPTIFKAYDIRGVVGRNVDETFAEHLGRAFGSEAVAAGEKAVAVGRDGRVSGPGLAAALVRGLKSTGLDVVDIGMVTTPMLYYVAATRAVTLTVPPSSCGSRPWWMAFSTSGCSSSGGTGTRRAASSASMRQCSRSSMREPSRRR